MCLFFFFFSPIQVCVIGNEGKDDESPVNSTGSENMELSLKIDIKFNVVSFKRYNTMNGLGK